jgi:hypothetical protein
MGQLRLLILVGILAGIPATVESQDPRDRYPPDTINVKRFPLRGQVAHMHKFNLTVDINSRSVSGGLDGAMTVPYNARGLADYNRFKMGDWVMGDIIVSQNRLYVINLRVVTEEEATARPPRRRTGAPRDSTAQARP